MTQYRRLLHIYPEGHWLFITFHLHGSLPRNRYPPPSTLNAGQAFVWLDRYLDNATTGPLYLRRPEIAELVIESLFKGEHLGHYTLGPFVIMANHVHVLLLPIVHTTHLLRSLKGATAREANRLLNRTGEPFWQTESYDHYVRNPVEWQRIADYIEQNPVKAGLANTESEYEWSSANGRWQALSTHHQIESCRV